MQIAGIMSNTVARWHTKLECPLLNKRSLYALKAKSMILWQFL